MRVFAQQCVLVGCTALLLAIPNVFATRPSCTAFVGFKLPCSGSTWWSKTLVNANDTHIIPQLHTSSTENGHMVMRKMKMAAHCDTVTSLYSTHHQNRVHRPPKVAGFTINPLSNRVVNFTRFVAEEGKQGRVMIVQYVRSNIIKQAVSYIMKKVIRRCNGIANLGKKQMGNCVDKLHHVDLDVFAAVVAAQAQLRIDFDEFMMTLGSDFYVMHYELIQEDKDRELKALFDWMGLSHLFVSITKDRFVKKNSEDLRDLIENFEELHGYLRGLEIPEDECPLLQMLTNSVPEIFPNCSHQTVKQRILDSSALQNSRIARKSFETLVDTGGRTHDDENVLSTS